ncbi:hypothetical protein pb186bvf_008250 [Paramecium bursaria]
MLSKYFYDLEKLFHSFIEQVQKIKMEGRILRIQEYFLIHNLQMDSTFHCSIYPIKPEEYQFIQIEQKIFRLNPYSNLITTLILFPMKPLHLLEFLILKKYMLSVFLIQ